MLKKHGQFFLLLLLLADMLVVAAAWMITCFLWTGARRLHFHAVAGLAPAPNPIPFMAVALILSPWVYGRVGLYSPKRTASIWSEALSIQQAAFLAWALTYLIVALLQPQSVSRLFMVSTLILWIFFASLVRMLGRSFLRYQRSRGRNLRRAAIVGTGRLGKRLHTTLVRNAWTGIEVRYFIDDSDHAIGKKVRNLPVLNCTDDIQKTLDQEAIDMVFVAMSNTTHERIHRMIKRFSAIPVHLCMVPDLSTLQSYRPDAMQLDGVSILSLAHSPLDGWSWITKSIFDRIIASLGLIVLAFPMLVIALLVKLSSPGPVLYRQTRTSLGGRPFEILKFRTMRDDAEASTGPVWAVPDDPRVTRLGRFLRRTSLDELPQLINVLRGEMSLVGPRPERPELIGRFAKQIPEYAMRHQVKSGMTGWAQIHGIRGCTSILKRTQYDLFYIKNWSLALDLWILLLTPFRGLKSPNAY
jgi:Undecaprenyl-phosphate glucose phosphotransferase